MVDARGLLRSLASGLEKLGKIDKVIQPVYLQIGDFASDWGGEGDLRGAPALASPPCVEWVAGGRAADSTASWRISTSVSCVSRLASRVSTA